MESTYLIAGHFEDQETRIYLVATIGKQQADSVVIANIDGCGRFHVDEQCLLEQSIETENLIAVVGHGDGLDPTISTWVSVDHESVKESFMVKYRLANDLPEDYDVYIDDCIFIRNLPVLRIIQTTKATVHAPLEQSIPDTDTMTQLAQLIVNACRTEGLKRSVIANVLAKAHGFRSYQAADSATPKRDTVEREYVTNPDKVSLTLSRRVTASVDEEVVYEVDKVELNNALLEYDSIESAFDSLRSSQKTKRLSFDTKVTDIHMEHECSIEIDT